MEITKQLFSDQFSDQFLGIDRTDPQYKKFCKDRFENFANWTLLNGDDPLSAETEYFISKAYDQMTLERRKIRQAMKGSTKKNKKKQKKELKKLGERMTRELEQLNHDHMQCIWQSVKLLLDKLDILFRQNPDFSFRFKPFTQPSTQKIYNKKQYILLTKY